MYDYLKKARYSSAVPDERAIMLGLREILPQGNIRDCFLVDQIVFLEKQGEALHKPEHS